MSVRWPDVDHPRSPSWSWPPNLLVAQGPASWPRGRRPASEAEEILSEAAAWWDVERSGFRDGDRWLRNLGQAGSVLDLRLGSSLLANSNDPKYLGPESSGYVYLPGASSNGLTVPHESALSLSGDLEIIARVSADNWAPSIAYILSKDDGAGAYNYGLEIRGTGMVLRYTAGGTTYFKAATAQPLANGVTYWVRAILDVDNGASGHDVKFFYAPDSATVPSSWTQIGATVTTAGVVSLTTNTKALAVGILSDGSYALSGKVYRAQVLSGIDGTTVLDIDCDALTSGSATSFTCATGQTVSIARSSSGRKSVVMPARRNGGRACMLLGTDDYLECVDAQQHGLLNFYGSDSFTVLGVVRQWANVPTNNNNLLIKRAARISAASSGWALRSASSIAFDISDSSTRYVATQTAASLGTTQIALGVRRSAARTITAHSGATGTSATDGNANTATSELVRVGRASGLLTDYADIEFRAAAVWRRALTSREISVLANSGIWGT